MSSGLLVNVAVRLFHRTNIRAFESWLAYFLFPFAIIMPVNRSKDDEHVKEILMMSDSELRRKGSSFTKKVLVDALIDMKKEMRKF